LVLLAVAFAIAVGILRMRLQELERTLGAELQRDAKREWPRPAYAKEQEGVFQDLAQAGLAALADLKDEPLSCRAARANGLRETPDQECRAWVELHWPAAAIVLSATNARLARWDIRDAEGQGYAVDGMAEAGRIATLHMAMDPSGAFAIQTCLEVLGLGRDAATTGTVLGVAVGNAIVRGVFPMCAQVLNDASPEAKEAAATAIERIDEGLPPASRMFHSEALAQLAALMAQPHERGLDRLLDEDAFVESVRLYEALSRMADVGDLQARQSIAWREWVRELSLNPHVRSETSPTEFLDRYHSLKARLRLLQQLAALGAAHDLTGRWPQPPAPLSLTISEVNPEEAALRDTTVPDTPLAVTIRRHSQVQGSHPP
jgi:hypothetical protein